MAPNTLLSHESIKSLHHDRMLVALHMCLHCGTQNLELMVPVERKPHRKQCVLQQ